jgi:hypothetical protein
MMFMMPMPPTTSDTAATPATRSARVLAAAPAVFAISVRLRIEKSFSCSAGRRWRWRRSSVACAMPGAMSSSFSNLTKIDMTERSLA